MTTRARTKKVSGERAGRPSAHVPGRDVRLMVASNAARRLAAARSWLQQYPLDAEIVVIAASWEACDELVREDVRENGARFGVVRATLGRVAGLLAAPSLTVILEASTPLDFR